MRFSFLPLVVLSIGFSSCASLNQSLKFEEDDIYYTNDFQHRLNKQALLMNENVAMPDSTWEYFDESYANSIRPSYARQLEKFDSSDSSEYYLVDNEREYDPYNSSNRNSNWVSNVGVGVGVGTYYGYNAYYGGYQPNYYTSSNYYNRSYVSQRNQVQAPSSYEPRLTRYSPGANSRVVTPTSAPKRTTKPYINPNPGYNTNQSNTFNGNNRQYRSNGSGSSGGFNNSRSGGGSYTPSGTVRGYQRR
ncbi:MAG: hypothetical protein CL840_13565 [Crocinitomicaceae bacterium]|nr:hypothetical protein [Crocinitomicaceae bacterium]